MKRGPLGWRNDEMVSVWRNGLCILHEMQFSLAVSFVDAAEQRHPYWNYEIRKACALSWESQARDVVAKHRKVMAANA